MRNVWGCPEKKRGNCLGNIRYGNVHIRMQKKKSLQAAVMFCATLVNTHIHTDMQTTFDWLYYYLSQLSQRQKNSV